MKPGLTLTPLRWILDFAPQSVAIAGRPLYLASRAPCSPMSLAGLGYTGDPCVDAALRPSSKYFFEPRIGAAWQPRSLPHIRSFHGAFGMFSAPVPYSDYNHVVDIAPFATALSLGWTVECTTLLSRRKSSAACTPNSAQAVAGYMNFHNPYETSTLEPTA